MPSHTRLKQCLAALACTLLATLAPAQEARLAGRLQAALEQRALRADALGVIDNVLRHESGPPRAAPPLVRELLARPAAAADAAALFQRSVPVALLRFFEEEASDEPFEKALAAYIESLVEARELLRRATGAIDEARISSQLRDGLLTADALLQISVDAAGLEHANKLFLEATVRFVRALPGTRIPDNTSFASPIGLVSIGSAGDDVHGPQAALIIDPGGNDAYTRAPASDAISLIFDLAGNDRYSGTDLAVRGFSALVDFAGDDRYAMEGPGLGAAIAGASILLDAAGNDAYEARIFGLGAAAFGIGALLDRRGDDRYRVHAWGQGFALAGGLGLLWDRSGDDRYAAAGLPDPFNRRGALSGAQGSSFGYRTSLAGGIGILRDGAGNDIYEAQMFAQGTGYYYGLGLLWDESGDDRYSAVRYAQGNGVHEAVGALRDESGNDRYELAVGVGQGMGLDLALGVLSDAAGDDRYEAPAIAQGTATANGIGILDDAAGADRFVIGADARAWGHAEWLRGLPSLGFIFDSGKGTFIRDGKSVALPTQYPVVHEAAAEAQCPVDAPLERQLAERFDETMARLRWDDFDQVLLFSAALHCGLKKADSWNGVARLLEGEPPPQIAVAIARALRERPAPAAQMQAMQQALARHPSCGVRAVALETWPDAAAAQAALRSTCWRLQAVAIRGLTPN